MRSRQIPAVAVRRVHALPSIWAQLWTHSFTGYLDWLVVTLYPLRCSALWATLDLKMRSINHRSIDTRLPHCLNGHSVYLVIRIYSEQSHYQRKQHNQRNHTIREEAEPTLSYYLKKQLNKRNPTTRGSNWTNAILLPVEATVPTQSYYLRKQLNKHKKIKQR